MEINDNVCAVCGAVCVDAIYYYETPLCSEECEKIFEKEFMNQETEK